MPFTVVHQGGTKDNEYHAYARLLSQQLLKRGVSLDYVPRVKEIAPKAAGHLHKPPPDLPVELWCQVVSTFLPTACWLT
jgi:hypothetical protein